MSGLTENETTVLKHLHDGVIRPLSPIAQRAGLEMKAAEEAIEGLRAKGLVEQRKGSKWKITYDGKASLGVLPGARSEIEQAVDRLTEAEKDDVQEIAASQIQLLNSFYGLALDQARRSFRWALVASIVGLVFFIAAVAFVLKGEGHQAATISVISGAIVEIIAGINFYLYGRTTAQLSTFHGRLEVTQRFLLANSLCERLEGDLKEKTRSTLIARLADAAAYNSGEIRKGEPGQQTKSA